VAPSVEGSRAGSSSGPGAPDQLSGTRARRVFLAGRQPGGLRLERREGGQLGHLREARRLRAAPAPHHEPGARRVSRLVSGRAPDRVRPAPGGRGERLSGLTARGLGKEAGRLPPRSLVRLDAPAFALVVSRRHLAGRRRDGGRRDERDVPGSGRTRREAEPDLGSRLRRILVLAYAVPRRTLPGLCAAPGRALV
jgi:hypothetical protein